MVCPLLGCFSAWGLGIVGLGALSNAYVGSGVLTSFSVTPRSSPTLVCERLDRWLFLLGIGYLLAGMLLRRLVDRGERWYPGHR
jgi:hypothetical protein